MVIENIPWSTIEKNFVIFESAFELYDESHIEKSIE